MSSDPLSIGIDFGTTNSRMAWYNPDTQQSEIILNAEGEYKTPSLVYFGEEETLVGKPVEDLLEEAEDYYGPAEREDVNQRVVKSIKRNLLNPPIIPIPGREPVRPVEVVAEILGKLKRDAEEEHFQEAVERVVITCPARFDVLQRKVISDAAALAGFGVVELLEEPVAAAIAYARLGHKVGTGVLVYDLGAGTFEISLVAREEDGSFYVPMEPQGDPRCGGDDLDLALYYHCEEIAQEQLGRPISLAGSIDLAFLRQCHSSIEKLSVSSRSRFSSYLASEKGSQRFRYEVDRETFEGLIRPLLEVTAKKTAAMVEQAKEQGHEVDTVVLIGGSSRVPLVGRLLGETLPVRPRTFAEKDYAVALGAAYRAHDLWDEESSPKTEEYRRTLEVCWSDGKVSGSEAGLLADLEQDLELSQDAAARIECEVMGETLVRVLERQQHEAEGHYGRILELIWKDGRLKALGGLPPVKLDVLLENRGLFCNLRFDDSPLSTEERKELLGEMPWEEFVIAARMVVNPELSSAEAQEQLRAMAGGLALSEDQAAKAERQVLGDTVKEFVEHNADEVLG